jgi:hypothetical protein
MSAGKYKPFDQSDLPGCSCTLGTLKRRSQIDFEIDFFERILCRDVNYVEVLIRLGELLSLKGWHRRALQVDQRLAQLKPQDPVVAYNLACSYAVLNQIPTALEALRQAVRLGYCDADYMVLDPDLTPLHTLPEFQHLIRELDGVRSATRVV